MSKARLFVLLKHHLDAESSKVDFAKGLLNEQTPYSYHLAAEFGYEVHFSKPFPENNYLFNLFRRMFARIFGFDLMHGLRNLREMNSADVVWTHTEREFLAVLLFRAMGLLKRPRVLCQSVWLIDNWPKLPSPQRILYKKLMKFADHHVLLSTANTAVARELGLHPNPAYVPFGATLEPFLRGSPSAEAPEGRRRILSLGNDIHRDWPTLLRALGTGAYDLKILTPRVTALRELAALYGEADISKASSASELIAAYGWADVVVVPLGYNLHASGITTILEAVAFGVPVVTADTGGLRDYFGEDLIKYYSLGDVQSLAEAVEQVFQSYPEAQATAELAKQHLLTEKYTAQGYIEKLCAVCPAEPPMNRTAHAGLG